MSQANYIIGIDLGTTNCTLSYASLKNQESEKNSLNQFSILQVIKSHEMNESLSLPSFIYFPLSEELSSGATHLPWDKSSSFTIGAFARDRGAELPHQVIASAKSWLCHPHINRREKLLPLEGDENKRFSPLEACAETLKYLKEAWNYAKPHEKFEEQVVLVTIPASFDPSARQLVQEAAQLASYPEIMLLEEPQAAFYAWLDKHSEEWRKDLKVGDVILVIDIGGGTTDFSLISVEQEEGNLNLKRQAVGSHLLLGGDNIDLSLAYLVKQKLEDQGHSIDHWQLQSLVHQCRDAKEKLLGDSPPASVDITILGRGSRLFSSTVKTELAQKEVIDFVMNGFLPLVEPNEQSPTEQLSGFQQVGLPYAKDPRISCQLAKFLSMSGEAGGKDLNQFVLPTAVLFNGGTLKSSAIRNQFLALLNQWAQVLKKPPVKELKGADYDYAVSLGATYYGLARQGKAIRIRGGTSRSYYIGVEEAIPAIPGLTPPLRAVCIVPFGLEEGEECDLENQEFALALGEMAKFRFFSHATPLLSNGETANVGGIVRNWKEELSELHPIETVLDKSPEDGKTVRVKLKSKVTELGVLELWALAEDGRKWKLEFDVRKL